MPTWTLSLSCSRLFKPRQWLRGVKPRPAESASAGIDSAASGPDVSARRAEAMRGFFPKLALWIDQQGYAAEMAEAHSYLSQATDLGELERRIRVIERRSGATRWRQ
jgi:hypothetical protein